MRCTDVMITPSRPWGSLSCGHGSPKAYSLLHWSYPRDMRRLHAKQEAAKEQMQAELLKVVFPFTYIYSIYI